VAARVVPYLARTEITLSGKIGELIDLSEEGLAKLVMDESPSDKLDGLEMES
jgi:hypothetical protein